jgi:thioredoxin-related protein
MTKKLLILLFFLSTSFLYSQNSVWRTSMDDAMSISKDEGKPMLILFTSSNASEALQNEVFKSADFSVWSRDNVVLVKLDLSDINADDNTKQQNLRLKNAFGVDELPQVCFANASVGKNKTTFTALGKIGYKSEGAKSWISESNAILHPSDTE